MRSYIEKRLENLIGEHANGQTAIRNLEAQLTAMRETVTRINGAITLCQEALRDAPKEEPVMIDHHKRGLGALLAESASGKLVSVDGVKVPVPTGWEVKGVCGVPTGEPSCSDDRIDTTPRSSRGDR